MWLKCYGLNGGQNGLSRAFTQDLVLHVQVSICLDPYLLQLGEYVTGELSCTLFDLAQGSF